MSAQTDSKAVLIAGGYGYVANHVAKRLAAEGWQVIRLIRQHDPAREIDIEGSAVSIIWDELDDVSCRWDQTVILNLATHINLSDEMASLHQTIASNISLGVELLRLADERRCAGIISAESYWQFGADGHVSPNSFYAAAKAGFSVLLEHFGAHKGRAVAAVIYDVYGPNDGRGKLLNAAINHPADSAPLPMTAGHQILDFIHVDDVARALLVLSERVLSARQTPGFDRYTIRSMKAKELADHIADIEKALGRKLNVGLGERSYPPHQIMTPWLPGADHQVPGWRPQVSFAKAMIEIDANG